MPDQQPENKLERKEDLLDEIARIRGRVQTELDARQELGWGALDEVRGRARQSRLGRRCRHPFLSVPTNVVMILAQAAARWMLCLCSAQSLGADRLQQVDARGGPNVARQPCCRHDQFAREEDAR